MANCPKCGQAIDSDFGMFNCPACQVFLSVDLDGKISLAEDVNDVPPSKNEADPATYDVEPVFDAFEINPTVEPEVATPASMDFGQVAFTEEEVEEPKTRVLDSASLDDVVEFGNSALSSSQTGGILYDIYLSGIDTAEIREEIRLHVGDRKFLWNVEDVMRSIKNGRLVIRRVNAVKAALFIQRIKHLDVDIQWKQHEIVRL